jgi:hypothetical protein
MPYNLTYRSDKESALTYDELDDNFRYFAEAIQNTEGYVHPTGDGNLHVPATSTSNNGKVLTAGTTAGSLSWTTPASTYTLPTASSSVLGGIKVGTNLTISNGVLSTTANYYVHPNHSGDDFSVDTGALTGATVVSDIDINVTTDTLGHVTDANGSVTTRTLTLGNLGYTGATNANYYVHPNHSGDDFSVDTGALTGATVVSDIDINVTTDTLGHVTDANGSVTTRTLTLANLGYTGASNANYYVHPNVPGNLHLPSGGASGQRLLWSGSGQATWANDYVHPTGPGHNHIPLGGSSNQYLKYSSYGVATWATITATGNFVPSNSSSSIYPYTLTAADFIISSDRRLKSNIKNLEMGVLHLLSEINPVTYDDGDIGFIAQDFEDRVPELVSSDDDGYLALKYSKITALLWKQNQELLKRIEVLENR